MSTLLNKPTVKVGTIGPTGHGKTTLTAALTRVCSKVFGSGEVAFDKIESFSDERACGITIKIAQVEYDSNLRRYGHFDCPGHEDYVRNMITGAAQMDGAILVCSAVEDPAPQILEHILLARQVGVPYIVVFLNKADMVDGAAQLEVAEAEVRDLLNNNDIPADDTPIIIGSALMALNAQDDNEMGTTAVRKLVETLDSYISTPVPAIGKPFLMPIEEVISASSRGTVVTGRIERGIIKTGEKLEIVGLRDTSDVNCDGVEISSACVMEGQAGDTCRLLLNDIKPEEVERGQVLVKPGTVKPHTQFEAEIYVLSKEEGGRHTPFFKGYRPQFYFRTTDVIGSCELPEGVEMVMPGDNVKVSVTLIKPIAMEDGLRFAIREGGRTVGAGVVAKIIAEAMTFKKSPRLRGLFYWVDTLLARL